MVYQSSLESLQDYFRNVTVQKIPGCIYSFHQDTANDILPHRDILPQQDFNLAVIQEYNLLLSETSNQVVPKVPVNDSFDQSNMFNSSFHDQEGVVKNRGRYLLGPKRERFNSAQLSVVFSASQVPDSNWRSNRRSNLKY